MNNSVMASGLRLFFGRRPGQRLFFGWLLVGRVVSHGGVFWLISNGVSFGPDRLAYCVGQTARVPVLHRQCGRLVPEKPFICRSAR